MRQTFQQWMVLLSALVLLLLPALLCHATPMYSASSSSSAYHRNPSGIKDFTYYHTRFRLEPNMRTLTNDEYEKHFGTQIHYKGTPHALKRYGEVWLVGAPSSERPDVPRYLRLEKIKDNGIETISVHISHSSQPHQDVEAAREFGLQYGEKAQGLMYGRPFAERKKSLFGYKVPKWKDIEKLSTVYNLETTGFPHLRATLDQYNYLKVHDPVGNKLLGFALDKKGEVLFKDFIEHVRV
ncbi:uncharacterized protein UBRO_20229 [Ustilago bromivora]|uniref:Uncharacterized protein n=1 Tax=Ustilago bromivora TaxID=307758 RepID=A0A1K0HB02_9BASI|nr:uncharacterized protein UBRO_20229 [Ustilago bromivora]